MYKYLSLSLFALAFTCCNVNYKDNNTDGPLAGAGAVGSGQQAGTPAGWGEAGSSGSQAGTSGSEAGTSGSQAGTSGSEAGTSGSEAGTSGSEAGTGGTAAPVPYQELISSVPYNSNPDASSDEIGELAVGNTAFALDMYQALISGAQDGFFFSPYSISVALAMTYAGAENNTETEMAETMHFTLSEERLHPTFNAVNIALNSRGQGAAGADGEGFRLNVVNSIWGQTGFEFLSSFLDLLAQNYEAGLRLLDFIAATEASRETINNWVEEKTEDRIQDLLPPGSISADTRLVLVNAVYFNAAWLNPFEEAMTENGGFTTLDGTTVQTPMMKQQVRFSYFDGEGFTAVDLPYDGRELSMLIVVPDSGQFESFEAGLTPQKLTEITAGLTSQEVILTMPKWTFEPEGVSLTSLLKTLGMSDAFNPQAADFSGMDAALDLYISDVVHKAFVAVDEAGTEAAAATAVIISLTSAPLDPVVLNVDRPFIYIIRDIETQTILFIGRMIDPTQTQ